MMSDKAAALWVLVNLVSTTVLLGQASDVPPIIRRGLEAYRTSGADSAVAMWLTESPLENEANMRSSTVAALHQIEGAYGPEVGYELLSATPIGQRVLRVYLVILYEKGPLYVWFDCYKPSDHWLVSSFLFNVRADSILPTQFFKR